MSAIGQEMVDRFGEPPAAARSLLYVVSLRAVAAQAQIQSIATEDGVAVVRMREGETLPRESLEATVLKGVQVGRTVAARRAGGRLARALKAYDGAGSGGQSH